MAPSKSKSKPNRRGPPPATASRQGDRSKWIGIVALVLALSGGVWAYVMYGLPGRPKITEPEPPAPLNNSTNPVEIPGPAVTEISHLPGLTDGASALATDATELLKLGNDFLNLGQPAKAIPYYLQAVQSNAENEEIHFNLGFAYTRVGATNEAIHHYRESLRIFPEYVEAHNNLGNIYVSLGQYGRAIEHFSSALVTMPDNASALNNLGKCLAAQGKLDESVNQFSQALRIDPNYFEARYNLGQALLAMKRYDEAMVEFEEALRLRPDFRPAAAGLARARDLKAKAGP